MSTTPYEVIAGPFEVYQAAVGEAFPVIDVTPAGNWAKIGTSGDRNITEDGVTVKHEQEIEEFRGLGGTGPQKVFRTSEDLIVSFTLADLTLEQYRLTLNGNTVTDTAASSGVAGHRDLYMYRGLDVSQVALLIRGAFSPYGQFNMQFEIPVCFQMGSPEVVFQKGTPAALAFEYKAIEDPNASTEKARFGTIVAQDAAAL